MTSSNEQTGLKHGFPGPWFLVGACFVIGAMIWRWNRQIPLPFHDLYPLYYGARAWLLSGNAYDLSTVTPTSHEPFLVYRIGNGYPLPAVLLTLPFALLPERLAATLWVGLLASGLVGGLRLLRAPLWLLFYVPLLEGLRLEQYSVLIVVLQLCALWCLHERRPWLLAFCCALMLTKPNHGALFALAMALLARNWREQLTAAAFVWGAPLLLDPDWPAEWLAALRTYAEVSGHPRLWWLLPLAGALLLWRDWIGAVVTAQLALVPFPGVYAACSLTIGLIEERRSIWLSTLSLLWAPVALAAGKPAATALTLVLPVAVLSLLRARREGAALRDAEGVGAGGGLST